MRHIQYGNPDGNQRAIVDALRAVGASVAITTAVGGGFVDLVVGFRRRNHLLEVKLPKGALNKSETAWHQGWRGEARVVRSPVEALEAIGIGARRAENVTAGLKPEPSLSGHTLDECDDPTCRSHWRRS